MFLRILKWTLVSLVALVVTLCIVALVGLQLAERKRQRVIEVSVAAVPYSVDPGAVSRGRYLFETRGCANCHGVDGAGRVFENNSRGIRLAGPNLTPTGVVAAYTERDWVRSIRHGVAPNGRPLRVMPSEDFNRFTDDDVAALVAYMRNLPPANGGSAIIELPWIANVAYGFGLFPDAASRIDHSLPPARTVPEGITAEYGAYVASMCVGCHGTDLAGGRIPSGPPDWPPAARLAPGEGSVMVRYPDAEALMRLFKTGTRPDGSKVAVMSFESLAKFSETDVRALYLHLKNLPTPTPSRR